MKDPAIQEAWEQRKKLRIKGETWASLWLDLCKESEDHRSKRSEPVKDADGLPVKDDDGYTCYTADVFYAEGERLRANGKKMNAKSDACFAEADMIYCEAVIEKYGPKAIIDWHTGEVEVREMKVGDYIKYSKPAKGEEGIIFEVIEGPYENGRVHILCINSDLPHNVEVVMKEDVRVI